MSYDEPNGEAEVVLPAAGQGDRPTRWPSAGSEPQRWEPTSVTGRDAGRAYVASVPATISRLTPTVSADSSRLATMATVALTRFDSELGHSVETFAPLLLRSEAASSSQIENLTASARSILSAEAGARGGRNAAQVVANTRAMTAALTLADDITPGRILEMHAVLMEGQPRHTPGRWREEPVWIGTSSESPVGAVFVAPRADRIRALIGDLSEFARRRDMDPLTHVALAHAQFETIHPFTDGNGRTGRALAQSMLRYLEVTTSVAVPVSAGLLADIDGYHHALTEYRNGDVEPIVRSFANAALRAVENARELVDEIESLKDGWRRRLTARRDSNAWRLLDILARRPVLTAAAAAQELGVSTPNVYPPLRALNEAGIVQSKDEHGLGPLWRSDEVLASLDRFAERSGRRSRA